MLFAIEQYAHGMAAESFADNSAGMDSMPVQAFLAQWRKAYPRANLKLVWVMHSRTPKKWEKISTYFAQLSGRCKSQLSDSAPVLSSADDPLRNPIAVSVRVRTFPCRLG